MSEKEYKMYSKSKEIISKSFSIKISGKTAEINKKKHYSNDNTFNFTFKKQLNECILECCDTSKPYETRERAEGKSEATNRTESRAKPIIVKTLNVLIAESWTKCKRDFKASAQSINAGDFVMAKMSTYSPWPARVNGFSSNRKRANVFFFGESNTGQVNVSEITPFTECTDVIRLLLLRKLSTFHKAIAELESTLQIPPHLSLLKDINAIENA